MSAPPEGDYVCRTCLVALNWHTEDGWVHPLAAIAFLSVDEHAPDPVPAGAVLEHRYRCDFCFAPDPTWSFPCESFPLPEEMRAAESGYESYGDWAACDACRSVIERGRSIGARLPGDAVTRLTRLGSLGPSEPRTRSSQVHASVPRVAHRTGGRGGTQVTTDAEYTPLTSVCQRCGGGLTDMGRHSYAGVWLHDNAYYRGETHVPVPDPKDIPVTRAFPEDAE